MDVTRSWYKYLGHDDKLIARKLELLDSVAQDDLGETVRIHLCGTGSEIPSIPSDGRIRTLAVSKDVIPWSYLSIGCERRVRASLTLRMMIRTQI